MTLKPLVSVLKNAVNQPVRQLAKRLSTSVAATTSALRTTILRPTQAHTPTPFHPPKDTFSPASSTATTVPVASAYSAPLRARTPNASDFPAVPGSKATRSVAPQASAADRKVNLDGTWERLRALNPYAWNPHGSLEEKLQQIQAIQTIKNMPNVPTHRVTPGIQRLDYAKAQAGIRELESLNSVSPPVTVGSKAMLKPQALPATPATPVTPSTPAKATAPTKSVTGVSQPGTSPAGRVQSTGGQNTVPVATPAKNTTNQNASKAITAKAPAQTLKVTTPVPVSSPARTAVAKPLITAKPNTGTTLSKPLPKTRQECVKALQQMRKSREQLRNEIAQVQLRSDLAPGQKLEMLKIYQAQNRRNTERHNALLGQFNALLRPVRVAE